MLLMLIAVLQASQSPDSLALSEAIRLALARRGTVSAASARVGQARGAARQASTISNPVARYSYTDDAPRQHASAEQSLEWLLSRGPSRAAGRAGVESALADSAQQAAEVAADVRGAYFRALLAETGVVQAAAQRALADSLVRIADHRLAAGDISQYERDQVALEAARIGLLESLAREAARSSRADLRRAIALPADSGAQALVGTLDAGLRPGEPLESGSDPLALRMALSDSSAAALRVKATARSRVPLPTLEAGADWGDPGAPGQALLVFGLSMPLPLWNQGGANQAVAAGQSAEASANLREVRATFEAERQVAAAHVAESAARALALRDTLAPAAAELRRRATLAYAAGETGVLPVLYTLRSERELTVELLGALLSWQLAVAEWNRLHGRAE